MCCLLDGKTPIFSYKVLDSNCNPMQSKVHTCTIIDRHAYISHARLKLFNPFTCGISRNCRAISTFEYLFKYLRSQTIRFQKDFRLHITQLTQMNTQNPNKSRNFSLTLTSESKNHKQYRYLYLFNKTINILQVHMQYVSTSFDFKKIMKFFE